MGSICVKKCNFVIENVFFNLCYVQIDQKNGPL